MLRKEIENLITPLTVPLTQGEVSKLEYQADVINQDTMMFVDNFEYGYYRDTDPDTHNDYAYLKQINNSEGYAHFGLNPKVYYYYYRKDHLGNNREVWRAHDHKIVQRTQYYPFGLPWSEYKNPEAQPYKYNGKEFIEMHGYNAYDYGARYYDATIGRWETIDPLAEKSYSVSPYIYCANNPINRIDPDGMREWPVNKTYKGHTRSHENNYGTPRANHKGVDINIGSSKDDLGAPVFATHDGTVTRVASITNGDTDPGGTRVKITSANGEVSTYYMHLGGVTKGLKVGSPISEGDQIGTIGGSGDGSPTRYTPHLHYELSKNGARVNPATSPTSLIDPQVGITPTVLPEVTVTGQAPSAPAPQLNIPKVQIPEIIPTQQ